MKKLTYWICDHKTDSACYSIRAKTKKEAELQRNGSARYEPARKVVIEYIDDFDLACKLLAEGGAE